MTDLEPATVEVRPMSEADWERVAAIYADGLATGNASFEAEGFWTLQAGIFAENVASVRVMGT